MDDDFDYIADKSNNKLDKTNKNDNDDYNDENKILPNS